MEKLVAFLALIAGTIPETFEERPFPKVCASDRRERGLQT